MKLLPREAWTYAILLIVLFALAGVAVQTTIQNLPELAANQQYHVLAVLIWALTVGFMFIAGAFGLWAIRFSSEAESRRRIGGIVDAMDYLQDGILAVDRRKRIRGSNSPARKIAAEEAITMKPLHSVFPCLSEDDLDLLLHSRTPNEVEREFAADGRPRVLRFRSQPAEGMTMLLVSDVTLINAQRLRKRQVTRLQLIGEIGRGVAHDFNNLMCVISGHLSLLSRLPPGSSEAKASIEQMKRSAEQAISLAEKLRALSPGQVPGRSHAMVEEHLKSAVDTLRDSLSAGWQVQSELEELPPTGLTGIQLEQVIANLGFIAADAAPTPSTLYVTAAEPGEQKFFDVSTRFSAVIAIGTTSGEWIPNTEDLIRDRREPGIIQSVIGTMLKEWEGELDCFRHSDGQVVFRICLPPATSLTSDRTMASLPAEIAGYMADWTVLIAVPVRRQKALQTRLKEIGTTSVAADNVATILARVEEATRLDAMIIDRRLLRREAAGILRAILKLRPTAGLVVLTEDTRSDAVGMQHDILFLPVDSAVNDVLNAAVEAKGLATHRDQRRK
jgi:hypothetical protein